MNACFCFCCVCVHVSSRHFLVLNSRVVWNSRGNLEQLSVHYAALTRFVITPAVRLRHPVSFVKRTNGNDKCIYTCMYIKNRCSGGRGENQRRQSEVEQKGPQHARLEGGTS